MISLGLEKTDISHFKVSALVGKNYKKFGSPKLFKETSNESSYSAIFNNVSLALHHITIAIPKYLQLKIPNLECPRKNWVQLLYKLSHMN